MKRQLLRFTALAFGLGFAAVGVAQSSQTLRGHVGAVEGNTLHLESAAGQDTIVELPDSARVTLRVPATLDAIKPGTFVGTAATPGPNGTLVASEVHIFPESRARTGEGHRPMPGLPGSTMTNATVAGVSATPADPGTMTNATVENVGSAGNARTLRLTYQGGEQTVVVPDKTPIVTVAAGSRASLTPGAHVIVYAQRAANGALTAQRISVGANGSVPPI